MPEENKKERKRVIVEEIAQESVNEPEPQNQPTIEVPANTKPHTEPGIHEEVSAPQSEPAQKPLEFKTEPVSSPPAPSLGPNPLLIIVPGIFLLGALLGGIVYYQKNISSISQKNPTPIATLQATSTPTPSPEAEIDLEKYSVKVLNGSGISGEAGKVQTLLEKEGFKVASTGNASNYDYTKTVIQAKSSVEAEFITKLTETLSKTYSVDTKSQSLSSSSGDSVIVVVGSSKI